MHPRDATALQAAKRWPRSFAVINGRRLAYVRLGEGAPPIVFLSGAGMDIGAAPPFPDVPLVVVTGGKRMRMVPAAAFAAHKQAQRNRAALAPRGRQVIAEASGHFPQLHEPEVVIAAPSRT